MYSSTGYFDCVTRVFGQLSHVWDITYVSGSTLCIVTVVPVRYCRKPCIDEKPPPIF